MSADHVLSFGPFRLMPSQRMLLEGERPLRLGSRAFDILVTLAERAGEVVSNGELMARVWPNTVVEPGALRVHLFGLRKALGDGRGEQRYIVNVPQQGYCFVAPVERAAARVRPAADDQQAATQAPEQHAVFDAAAIAPLPVLLTRVVGRDELVGNLVRELPTRRCVTFVGTGGIGKTTLAIAVAHGLAPAFGEQVLFVGLAPLEDPRPSFPTRWPPPSASRHWFRTRSAASAPTCATSACYSSSTTASTSSIRFRSWSSNSWRPLPACTCWPPAGSRCASRVNGCNASALSKCLRRCPRSMRRWPGATRHWSFFIERVRASVDSFDPPEPELAMIAGICRAVDGIPLAIELAAAGVERLGVRGVAAHLGDRLSLLTRGRRTALPRHQTLRAALDWSYGLLMPAEQAMLRHLSVFRGRFTLEAALAVCAASPAQGAGASAEDLFNLLAKSLLSSDIGGEAVQDLAAGDHPPVRLGAAGCQRRRGRADPPPRHAHARLLDPDGSREGTGANRRVADAPCLSHR